MALQGIISAAKEELREQFPTSSYPEDLIHEIVDSSVPIYHHELAELASDPEIFPHENELGPTFDGTPTLANITATAIYELITEAPFETLNELQNEQLDERQHELLYFTASRYIMRSCNSHPGFTSWVSELLKNISLNLFH